jgi:hypothetical protein
MNAEIGENGDPTSPGGGAMRFVSLNLDVDDATILRRTLAGTLGAGTRSMAAVDEEYRALHAMIGELDRLLSADRPRRVALPSIGDEASAGRLRLVRGGRLGE